MANPAGGSFIAHEIWDRRASREACLGRRRERGDRDEPGATPRAPPAFEEPKLMRI